MPVKDKYSASVMFSLCNHCYMGAQQHDQSRLFWSERFHGAAVHKCPAFLGIRDDFESRSLFTGVFGL